jgi:hypothetical protein
MSAEEHGNMVSSGMVQEGSGGVTYVANPADPAAYARQAVPGSFYLEFEVPQSSLSPGGEPGWAQIRGPNFWMSQRLAKLGRPVPQFPPALNIEWLLTR